MSTTSVRARAGVAALASVLVLAGCDNGSTSHAAKTPAPSTAAAAAKAFQAVRWWSNGAAPVGSRVDLNNPLSDAAKLHASRSDYCQMLAQTKAAGKTLFTGVAATNTDLQVTITAFVAEIEAVAPSQVSGAWRTLGRAIVTMARSGGDVSHLGLNATAVQQAAATISADASTACHLSIKA